VKDYTVGKGKHQLMPFFPHEILRMINMMIWALVLIFGLAIFWPEHLAEPADPHFTPPHIKPEWYFLGSYQFLKAIPSKFAGVMIQGLFVLGVLLLPFLDRLRTGEDQPPTRRFVLEASIFVVAAVGLTIWGYLT
jgi:quinol-cytochrome oxidoreductase complex cytochrome b subunit